ncbi:MAG: hypothetical protein U0793_20090 [Gemmataceae bacterium]
MPLFALHTKGLSTLEGIECRGQITRNGKTQEYLLRISRNTASLYPGPLSRKIHFAFLSIATEQGFPIQNPITWNWRDLCRRMDIAYGGKKTLAELKRAIRSTHGVVIHSQYALYNKTRKGPLPLHERGHHLYADYAFCNEPLPDGTIADRNAVWLADWYLDNLNAFYSAPLDYGSWRSLEARSPTASRLYEFLLLNFYSGTPLFRINYVNLSRLLPVRTERYLSDAREQLQPALLLIQQAGVVRDFQWLESRDGDIQLNFTKGPLLRTANDHASEASTAEDSLGSVQVREIRNDTSDEWRLVRQFYQLWSGNTFSKPSPKELSVARDLLERYGATKLHALLPLTIRRVKEQWPDAKTFGAIVKYIPDVEKDYDRRQQLTAKQRDEAAREETARSVQEQKRKAQQEILTRFRPIWLALPAHDRQEIEQRIRGQWPHMVKAPAMFERYCILELARAPNDGVLISQPEPAAGAAGQ